MRFYPEFIPPFAYEPTKDRFEIRRVNNGVGEGVISLVDFNVGDLVFVFTGSFSSEMTQFTLTVNEALHLHDPFLMGKILHSCDPNCYVDMPTRSFIAIRPIKAGDFVTMDYAQTEPHLFKDFVCSCGASNCRGLVQGYLDTMKTPFAVFSIA